MQTLRLDVEDASVELSELAVIAIYAGGMPSYKLVHFLNKHLNWNLKHTRMFYRPPENPKIELDVFSHIMEADHVQWFLVNNKKNGQVWIPKMADVDYWLLFTGPGMLDFDTKRFLTQLTELDFIFAANFFPLEKAHRPEQKSPFFKYFLSLYLESDENNIIRNFE